MPLFTKDGKGILFVHIPKTGGTSVVRFFLEGGWKIHDHDSSPIHDRNKANWFRASPPQHFSADTLERIFRLDRLDGILTFVRHPVNRILSEFWWQVKRKRIVTGSRPTKAFDRWCRDKLSIAQTIRELDANHFRPQVDFVLPTSTIGKFETNLNEAFINNFLAKCQVPEILCDFPVQNQSAGTNFSLNRASLSMVEDFYAKDFSTFDYSPFGA